MVDNVMSSWLSRPIHVAKASAALSKTGEGRLSCDASIGSGDVMKRLSRLSIGSARSP